MFLCIDIGSAKVQLFLLGKGGRIIDQAGTPLTRSRSQPLWAKQPPQDWWKTVAGRLRQAHPHDFAQVSEISLSGQMLGAVLFDPSDQVLRPAILWNAGSSHAQCKELTERAPQIAGNLAMPGFKAPKLLWVRQHGLDIFAWVRSVFFPKDYLPTVLLTFLH